jgi:hypothetical protein
MFRRRSTYLLALVGVTVGLSLAGCDSIDPTEQTFAITFKNDTGRDVHLKLCEDRNCRHYNYSEGWRAGKSAKENISDRKVFTRWLVEDDATGSALGCLPLLFDQKYEDVVVRISLLVPCPGYKRLTVQRGKGLGRS